MQRRAMLQLARVMGTVALAGAAGLAGSGTAMAQAPMTLKFSHTDTPVGARQKAADKAGGNGFMSVSATHAAIRLAQGAGRLIRSTSDRGVVAVLDSRLSTERYGGFLRAALPPFWATTDPAVAVASLERLAKEVAAQGS